MLNTLKDFAKLILRTKQFAGAQNIHVRAKFMKFFQVLFFLEYRKRKALVKQIDAKYSLNPIPENLGYRKIDDLDPHLLAEVLKAAKELKNKTDFATLYQKSENKHLVTFGIPADGGANNIFMKFALHPPVLKMVSEYIGMLPVIENILFWYSPNKENISNSSQLYHLDGQDTRTLQMLLFVEDVDDESGPLNIVDADQSEIVADKINYRKTASTKRMSDELMIKEVPATSIHNLTGKAGDLYIVDTDRCFHFGSRKASKPRYMFVVQYYTPFAFALPWRWWKKLPYARIPQLAEFGMKERLILGSPK